MGKIPNGIGLKTPSQSPKSRVMPGRGIPPHVVSAVEAALMEGGKSHNRIAGENNIPVDLVKDIKRKLRERLEREAEQRQPESSAPSPSPTPPAHRPTTREGRRALAAAKPVNQHQRDRRDLVRYRRKLRKLVPIERRAAILAALVESPDPRVAAGALARLDEIDGFKQRLADESQAPTPGPMFLLPAGSAPAVDAPAPNDDLDRLAVRTIDVRHLLEPEGETTPDPDPEDPAEPA